MKARIEKKLSKKLVEILPGIFNKAWVCSDVTELAWDQGSRISNMYFVGGGVNCWGEGEDQYTVLEDFVSHYNWHSPIYNPFPDGHELEGMPTFESKRLTGKYLIQCARKIARNTEQDNES